MIFKVCVDVANGFVRQIMMHVLFCCVQLNCTDQTIQYNYFMIRTSHMRHIHTHQHRAYVLKKKNYNLLDVSQIIFIYYLFVCFAMYRFFLLLLAKKKKMKIAKQHFCTNLVSLLSMTHLLLLVTTHVHANRVTRKQMMFLSSAAIIVNDEKAHSIGMQSTHVFVNTCKLNQCLTVEFQWNIRFSICMTVLWADISMVSPRNCMRPSSKCWRAVMMWCRWNSNNSIKYYPICFVNES